MSSAVKKPLFDQPLMDLHDELIVDLFAGGGGASSGIEQALGRMVDIAINHDAKAVAVHRANHPQTKHYTSDVFEIDPRFVTGGRPVGLLWASPDCTFHSKARGKKPIRSSKRKRRALAWVVTRWAGQVKPRVIYLENVEEFADWGPLVAKRERRTKKGNEAGRCLKASGEIATGGEYVPLEDQELVPSKRHKRRSFDRWVQSLRDNGYEVEWRELIAYEYGAPTIRKRLFLTARCDGKAISWSKVGEGLRVYGDPNAKGFDKSGLKPWRTTAECIDWSVPMLSIFASREEARAFGKKHGRNAPIRPLVFNTNRRIARGVLRFVLKAAKPYLVRTPNGIEGPYSTRVDQTSGAERNGVTRIDEPSRTIHTANGQTLSSALINPITHRGEHRIAKTADEPFPTVTTSHRGEHGLVGVGLYPRYGEAPGQEPRCRSAEEPSAAVVGTGNGDSLFAASMTTYHTEKEAPAGVPVPPRGQEVGQPINTLDTQNRYGVVGAVVSEYYGSNVDGRPIDAPSGTQTTHDRSGVVGALMAQHNGGFAEGNSGDGRPMDAPSSTITNKGSNQGVIGTFFDTNHSDQNWDNRSGRPIDEPSGAVCAFGNRQTLIGAGMTKFAQYGEGQSPDEPLDTVMAGAPRHGIVGAQLMTNTSGSAGREVDSPSSTLTTGEQQIIVGSEVHPLPIHPQAQASSDSLTSPNPSNATPTAAACSPGTGSLIQFRGGSRVRNLD
jgi:DNA (cytosine-5)-methyltransferase 1